MTTAQELDIPATVPPAETWVELRGPSGRLLGRVEVRSLRLEVKRKGEPAEIVDLRALLVAAAVWVDPPS